MHAGWYWLADACEEAGLHFVLAHPPVGPPTDLALIRGYDTQITALEAQLQKLAKVAVCVTLPAPTVPASANIWA